jgi:hypothetical protein
MIQQRAHARRTLAGALPTGTRCLSRGCCATPSWGLRASLIPSRGAASGGCHACVAQNACDVFTRTRSHESAWAPDARSSLR